MGMFEEPRYVIKACATILRHAGQNTIREQTFCCGSGAGLNAGEDMELRMPAACPGPTPSNTWHDKFGVNMLACVCAIDRAAFPDLMEYWVPGVGVTGRDRAGGQRPDSS
jgi:hypothetical protein